MNDYHFFQNRAKYLRIFGSIIFFVRHLKVLMDIQNPCSRPPLIPLLSSSSSLSGLWHFHLLCFSVLKVQQEGVLPYDGEEQRDEVVPTHPLRVNTERCPLESRTVEHLQSHCIRDHAYNYETGTGYVSHRHELCSGQIQERQRKTLFSLISLTGYVSDQHQ